MAIVMYTKEGCPFCIRAKELLANLGQEFEEIDIVENPHRREEMIEKAHGASTVPQIFINDRHIGGCDDLHELHEKGELIDLL